MIIGVVGVFTLLATAATPVLPPADADWDYQLGGDAPVSDNVGTVDRDRNSGPVDGLYNICYVNGFQTQPEEKAFWKKRWGLVLKKDGKPVVDEVWGEWLLDIGTSARRQRLAKIVGRWTDGCSADGFDAVEYDNLDSFSRSQGLVSKRDTRRFASLLVRGAHDTGLAAGQKNWVELGERGPQLGFDFAIAEECGRWKECGGYLDTYGESVLVVEYRKKDFAWTCNHFAELPVVRRDVDLSADGVRDWC